MVYIGIDLGNTNCCVACLVDNKIQIIPNEFGNKTTPSCIAFHEGKILIGEDAKVHQNKICDIKKIISRNVVNVKEPSPFQLIDIDDTRTIVLDNGEYVKPEEIYSHLLRKLKENAENYLQCSVENAVVSVPAQFNSAQREVTIRAGDLAGLKVRLINEPTAAALDYTLTNEKDGNILVCDMGSSSFDASVINIRENIVTVNSTAGDVNLGGQDIDDMLTNYCTNAIEKSKRCEIIKCYLSNNEDATLEVSINQSILSSQLHNLILNRLLRHIDEALEAAGVVDKNINGTTIEELLAGKIIKKNINVNEIVLVGGSMKMPIIRDYIHKYIKKPINTLVDPDEAVARGAAIQGAIIEGTLNVKLLSIDVLSLPVGVESDNGSFEKIIECNTPIPVTKTQSFMVENDNNNIRVNLLQGKGDKAKDNCFLYSYDLLNDNSNINITIDIDENGVATIF